MSYLILLQSVIEGLALAGICGSVQYVYYEPRKVRTPKGNAKANRLPSQDEEQWNREKVQGNDP